MFKKLVNNLEGEKFCIILGSGFHKQGIGQSSILSNWELLLSKLSSEKSTQNYILDFEKHVINKAQNISPQIEVKASDIEQTEINHLVNAIKKEQSTVLSKESRFKYPKIFNSKIISDVVSLNFDMVAEELYKKNASKNIKIEWQNKSSFNQTTNTGKPSQKSICLNTSFRKIENEEGESIRFWYPHGCILRPKQISLGVYRYSKLIGNIEQIRKSYKASEREFHKAGGTNRDEIDLTWFSQIVNKPVLILGASISEMEWVMWTVFVFRKRNFAKPQNKLYEFPIFAMTTKEDSLNSNNDFWFQPLFKGLEFDEQWKLLQKLLNNRNK